MNQNLIKECDNDKNKEQAKSEMKLESIRATALTGILVGYEEKFKVQENDIKDQK